MRLPGLQTNEASSTTFFADRREAGRKLAERLKQFKKTNSVVFALPRGGAVIGHEVAKKLHLPLDLVLVYKITHPTNNEYAIGAVVEGSEPIYDVAAAESVDTAWLDQATTEANHKIKQRRKLYFDEKTARQDAKGKTAIIVDDGIATGSSMEAAALALAARGAKNIIAASPVASSESLKRLNEVCDEVIVLDDPAGFVGAVGGHYLNFEQVSDEEVAGILREA